MSKSSWQHLTCQDTQFPGPAFRVELPSYWSKLRMHSQSAEPWTPDHSLQLLTSLPLASCLWLQVPSLRTRWEILLLTLCLLHGESINSQASETVGELAVELRTNQAGLLPSFLGSNVTAPWI